MSGYRPDYIIYEIGPMRHRIMQWWLKEIKIIMEKITESEIDVIKFTREFKPIDKL